MSETKRESQPNPCRCPYCNGAAQASLPFCQLCGAEIVRCRRCGRVLEAGQKACPGCGGEGESAPRRQGQ